MIKAQSCAGPRLLRAVQLVASQEEGGRTPCARGHGRGQPQLLLSKALSLLDGVQQLLFQLFIALVGWQIQTVKAVKKRQEWYQEGPTSLQAPTCQLPANSPRMAPGQPGLLANSVNAEFLGSIAPCHPRQGVLCVNTDGLSQSSQPTQLFPSPASRKMCMPCAVLPQAKARAEQRKNAPMSSANPPTGRRQVPVTNCSSRILFSLSISFTTCQNHWICLLLLV